MVWMVDAHIRLERGKNIDIPFTSNHLNPSKRLNQMESIEFKPPDQVTSLFLWTLSRYIMLLMLSCLFSPIYLGASFIDKHEEWLLLWQVLFANP